MEICGTEKDVNSTQHFLVHMERISGTIGDSRDGEGLKDCGRSVLELDPRAISTAESSLKELQLIGCLSDTDSHELLDKKEPETRARHRHRFSGRGEGRAGNVAHVLRHHLIMHASRLDTFSKVRGEVQDIATMSLASRIGWSTRHRHAMVCQHLPRCSALRLGASSCCNPTTFEKGIR